MKTLLALIVICLWTSAASAHLGETPAECLKRYGKAVAEDKAKDSMTFLKNGMVVVCHFSEGKCFQVEYRSSKRDHADSGKPEAMDQAQIKILIGANGLDPEDAIKNLHRGFTANYLPDFRVLVVTDTNAEERKRQADSAKNEAAAKAKLKDF